MIQTPDLPKNLLQFLNDHVVSVSQIERQVDTRGLDRCLLIVDIGWLKEKRIIPSTTTHGQFVPSRYDWEAKNAGVSGDQLDTLVYSFNYAGNGEAGCMMIRDPFGQEHRIAVVSRPWGGRRAHYFVCPECSEWSKSLRPTLATSRFSCGCLLEERPIEGRWYFLSPLLRKGGAV